MKATKFTKTQIVKILKDLNTGKPVMEIARKHGILKATLYNWRKKKTGGGASELSEYESSQGRKSPVKALRNKLDSIYRMNCS